jgi:DNA repair photolyase
MAPILPNLTDTQASMSDVIRAAREHGATSVWANVLYLKPGTREHFLENLARDWPELLPRYEALYARGAYVEKSIAAEVKSTVARLRREHEIADRRAAPLEPSSGDGQEPVGAWVPAPGQLPLVPPQAA